jgi:hypothetical protein
MNRRYNLRLGRLKAASYKLAATREYINWMMNFFDYVFYRWYLIYNREERDPTLSASLIVSAYQLLTIIFLTLLASRLFHFEIPNTNYIYPLIAIFYAINWYKYERDFDFEVLKNRWENESKKQKKVRGFFLVAYLIIVFLTPFIYGIFFNGDMSNFL